MPTFCNQGEKAYLRINDGDSISINGPIDIESLIEREYKGSDYRITITTVGYSTDNNCQRYGPPAISTSILNVSSNGGFELFNYRRDLYHCKNLYDVMAIRCTGSSLFMQYQGAGRGATLYKDQFSDIGSAPAGTVTATVVYTGSGVDSSLGQRYRLNIKKNGVLLLSKVYSTQPTYTVQCGDPCPIGYKRSGDRCAWQNVDRDGNPLPSDTDDDPNTPKGCPTGYFRFFNRCILLPGWKPGLKPGDPPIPPNPVDWNPFDRFRPPDPDGKCPPGFEPWTSPNGKKRCIKRCKPGEYRAKDGSCCCGAIPGLVYDLRSLNYEIQSISREYGRK